MKPAPNQSRMQELLERGGIHLNREQLNQLWRYHSLLRNRNQDRELTRIIEFESIVVKHYVDCMIVPKFLTLPSPLLDVGTGAGFPGIPLKIRCPHLEIILAEPRPKRVLFLEEAIREIGLRRTRVFEHKVVSASFQERVGGVITRAVETMDKTCLRTSGCLGEGAKLIFMKGPGVEPELGILKQRFSKSFRIVQDEHYTLPHTQHERRLVVLEKLVPPEIRQ